MLNPDGVKAGNYRGDLDGTNLNRVYNNPDPTAHPTIFAVVKYLDFLAQRGSVGFYLDFHAHANKRGVFVFGNYLVSVLSSISLVHLGSRAIGAIFLTEGVCE
jgi:murein tripeptide amidase MpaA